MELSRLTMIDPKPGSFVQITTNEITGHYHRYHGSFGIIVSSEGEHFWRVNILVSNHKRLHCFCHTPQLTVISNSFSEITLLDKILYGIE
jgi:hypothetical protein